MLTQKARSKATEAEAFQCLPVDYVAKSYMYILTCADTQK